MKFEGRNPKLETTTRKLDRDGQLDRGHPGHFGFAFGTATGAATAFAGLFVEFAATHFLLDAAVLDQLTKPTNRFLNRLSLTQTQLDHKCSPDSTTKKGDPGEGGIVYDINRPGFVKP